MTAKIIDGNAIAKEVRAQWKKRVERLKGRGVVPGLAVIIVGDNPASQVYVRNKVKACAEAGLLAQMTKPTAMGPQARVRLVPLKLKSAIG